MGKGVELSGVIRVTASPSLTHYVLMPLFKKFGQLHPSIELHLDLSNNLHNLARRDADVALRISRDALPENLIGRELGVVQFAIYGEKQYLAAYKGENGEHPLCWIGEDETNPRASWLPETVTNLQRTMRTNDVMSTVDAIKHGLGVGRLPTFMGDAEERLTQFPVDHGVQDMPIWLLTHVDMRRVNRMSVFNTFIVDEMRDRMNYRG